MRAAYKMVHHATSQPFDVYAACLYNYPPLLEACIPQFGMWDVDSGQHAVVDRELIQVPDGFDLGGTRFR
jgi:hypothetical protein